MQFAFLINGISFFLFVCFFKYFCGFYECITHDSESDEEPKRVAEKKKLDELKQSTG
jgi:hypothetical protein